MSKKNLKKGLHFVALILVIALSVGIVVGVTNSLRNKTVSLSSTSFSLGGLDDSGKYVDSDQSIYTKDAFRCLGLRIEPDFESNCTYDVYYYDFDDRLVEAKKGLTGVYDEDFPLAKTARIVMHPAIPDDVKSDDFKIHFWEVLGYAMKLKVTVDKNQKYLYANSVNLYDEDKATVGKTFDSQIHDNIVTLEDNDTFKVSEKISVTGEYEYYDVYVRCHKEVSAYVVSVVAALEDNSFLVRESFNLEGLAAGEWVKLTLEVPDYEDEMYLIARMPKDADCYIFGYND